MNIKGFIIKERLIMKEFQRGTADIISDCINLVTYMSDYWFQAPLVLNARVCIYASSSPKLLTSICLSG